MIEELRDPRCYPNAPQDVQIVQTHLSVVCITDDVVYKLKKAIALPFADFTTLAARRHMCREEVRLNRRLCPDTYLGTAALRRDGGRLVFSAIDADERDDDLDVAVVMRRLPQERMLDELLQDGDATSKEVEGLAALVAEFHAGADRGEQTRSNGDPDKLAAFAADNFTDLKQVAGHGLHVPLLDATAAASADDFRALLPALRERCAAGRVVDGHGDLHARNVCMTSPPTVYDCIEFEPAFRCGDVATEVAFLTMDLRYRGAPELARAFTRAYVNASGDNALPRLLPTLESYRAMVRAKVAAMAAAEPELTEDDRVASRISARRHLWLASALSVELRGPWWIVVCGPPACGKSHVARRLTDGVQWSHLSTDALRKQLAGLAPTERADASHYTTQFSDRTYAELQRQARQQTAEGRRCVVLDGNFATIARRAEVAAAAAAAGAKVAFAFVHVDVETAVERARLRGAKRDTVSDADVGVTRKLHAAFVRPTADECDRLVELDGTRPPSENVAELLTHLLA